ncbi:MAG TPA: histidine kinase N-terminal 7TM domain-containing protein [Cyclobacteriaceae bacterium]|jgi:signal transduction histidine kinase
MNLQPNTFAIILLISGLIELILSVVSYQSGTSASKWFSVVMFFISIWAIAYGFELMCSSLDQMIFWINIEYIGIAFLPSAWIIFTIKFVTKEHWLTPWFYIAVFIYSAIIVGLVWTNESHHLHYSEVGLSTTGPIPLLVITTGLSYHIHTIYFYLILLIGLALFLDKFRKSNRYYQNQTIIILFGMLIPWIANFIYLIGLRPYEHIDMTPFGFVLTSLFIWYGISRLKLFDILPVARSKLLERMQEGVLVVNQEDKIVDMNSAMKKFLSKGNSQLYGKLIYKILPGVARPYWALGEKSSGKFETSISVNNKVTHFEVTVIHLEDNHKNLLGTLSVFKDITERVQSHEELMRQSEELKNLNQLKDRLFTIIAHDLRGPLNSFLQLLSVQQAGEITDDQFKKILPVVTLEVGYTSSLLENLLQWSISQIKESKVSPQKINLNSIASEEFNLFIKKANEKGIDLINNVESDIMVYADEEMVRLIMRNLVANAIKYSKKNDLIKVSAAKEDGQIITSISDNGMGMDAAKMQEIIDGTVISSPGTDREKGTGLGLILCQDFVRRNNGRFWIESEVGKGTTVYFSLPVSSVGGR